MENFKDQTYDLAKALHYVSIAGKYFEMIAVGYEKGAKQLMGLYSNKMKWVINDIYDRLSDDSRKFYKESLIKGDTVFLDAISNKFLHLSEEEKNVVEAIVDNIIKQKEIKDTLIKQYSTSKKK